ncbi:YpoC family protein [Bacillus sp. Marseille-Q1617]|uniref:YpoC family protein n=1 Tax=Bacillus sp. Marseille-Q1617 TaxID=2736887 RepID=UPI00158D7737|nr:hypothetical protein [Bacillus sp. Marseille-Q1617]
MNAVLLKVPQQLSDPYFYTEDEVLVSTGHYLEERHFFAYEMLYFRGKEIVDPPWDDRYSAVKDVIAAWNEVQEVLDERFKSRDKSVQLHMKKGVALFYMLLFWSNSVPVVLREWQQQLEMLSLKPVNAEERIAFIRQNPKLYQSFVQLKELFQEQHKQTAKDMAISKLKKNKK